MKVACAVLLVVLAGCTAPASHPERASPCTGPCLEAPIDVDGVRWATPVASLRSVRDHAFPGLAAEGDLVAVPFLHANGSRLAIVDAGGAVQYDAWAPGLRRERPFLSDGVAYASLTHDGFPPRQLVSWDLATGKVGNVSLPQGDPIVLEVAHGWVRVYAMSPLGLEVIRVGDGLRRPVEADPAEARHASPRAEGSIEWHAKMRDGKAITWANPDGDDGLHTSILQQGLEGGPVETVYEGDVLFMDFLPVGQGFLLQDRSQTWLTREGIAYPLDTAGRTLGQVAANPEGWMIGSGTHGREHHVVIVDPAGRPFVVFGSAEADVGATAIGSGWAWFTVGRQDLGEWTLYRVDLQAHGA